MAVVFAVPAAFASLAAVVNPTTIGAPATMVAVNIAVLVLRREAWVRFAVVLVIGLGVYWAHGRRNSRLSRTERPAG